MSQNVTFQFSAPNSTRSLNDHIAKLLGDGPYHGMLVAPFGPGSRKVKLTAGYMLTREGVKIEETNDVPEIGTVDAPDANYPRLDVVVLHHKYDPAANPNTATYRIVKGIPTPPAMGHPLPPDQNPAQIGLIDPDYDYVLADIMVGPGMNAVLEYDIFNRYRVLTTPELRLELAEALFMAIGNFCYEGWNLSTTVPPTLVGLVSAGRGLLCGLPAHSVEPEFQINTLRAREYLYAPIDPTDPNVIRRVGANLTLDDDKQPFEMDVNYATKLRICIDCTNATSGTSGDITISGTTTDLPLVGGNPDTSNVIETLHFDVAAGQKQIQETNFRYRKVEHEGIDTENLIRANQDIRIYVTDKPVHYIYAVGTQSTRAYFRAELDPNYTPKCNEYLLGWMETDGCDNSPNTNVNPAKVIAIMQLSSTSMARVVELLPCDSVRRQWTLMQQPRRDTELVVMDGMTLRKTLPGENPDDVKGYTLVNERVITLGAQVETPDADTDFWVSYIRKA